MNAREMFEKLRRPKVTQHPSTPPLEDPEQGLAEALHEWSKKPEVAKYFLPFLDSLTLEYEANLLKSRGNHAETNFWLGLKVALEVLRIHLQAWRENRPPTPQEKGSTQ